MTTTVDRAAQASTGQRRAGPHGEGHASAHVPGPPRARRRWGVFAAMTVVVCLGALGNVWLHAATSNAQQVVAARSTIQRGSVISRDQLVFVQVGMDPSLRTLPGSQIDSVVGKRAALDVAAGTLLTSDSVTDQTIPRRGTTLVGVGAAPALMPGTGLMAGDRVRIVDTPGQQGDAISGSPASIAATVVSTATGADTGQGAQTIITVEVPETAAAELAAMAATGKVAFVLDSRER